MDGSALAASSGFSNDFPKSYCEMKGKYKMSVTSMVSARRESSTVILEERDGGFPVNDQDDLYDIFEIEAELAKMRNMTAEEAAARAAQVVAEAEVALAEAEEAVREAEAAEADAQAAVAALMILRGRNTCEMWLKKSGG